MYSINKLHRNESGQAALENAIILIAFIVVASVFAFTILSAGSSSTEKGEQAIYEGLEGVQSSMGVKGATIAQASGTSVETITFTVALAGGGNPVDLTADAADRVVVIGYRDGAQFVNNVDWTSTFIVHNDGTAADALLEEGELAEIVVDLGALSPALGPNTEFTLELKPPQGGVVTFTRTTPAAIETVMELR